MPVHATPLGSPVVYTLFMLSAVNLLPVSRSTAIERLPLNFDSMHKPVLVPFRASELVSSPGIALSFHDTPTPNDEKVWNWQRQKPEKGRSRHHRYSINTYGVVITWVNDATSMLMGTGAATATYVTVL